MALTEIQRSRTQRADKSGAALIYRVEFVYTCPQSEAASHETALWHTHHDQGPRGGLLPVISVQVVGADPNQPGNSLITVTYGRDLSYDPSTFPVDRATLALATRVTEKPLTTGPGEKGRYVETGPDSDGVSWRIVGGAGSVPRVDAMISVRTAYPPSSVDWPDKLARLGKINKKRMDAMMGVDKYQAMLIHANVPGGFRFGDPNVPIPIEYVFWVKPDGWLGRTLIQRYVHLPVRRPVLHEHTLESGELWYVRERHDLLEYPEPFELMTDQTYNAVTRQISGAYAMGATVVVAETPDGQELTGPGAMSLPSPVAEADFTDILRLIERGLRWKSI